jgi:hypothetical protein
MPPSRLLVAPASSPATPSATPAHRPLHIRVPRRVPGGHIPKAARNHPADRLPCLRVLRQRRVFHALLKFEMAHRLRGIGRFVNVSRHGERMHQPGHLPSQGTPPLKHSTVSPGLRSSIAPSRVPFPPAPPRCAAPPSGKRASAAHATFARSQTLPPAASR